MKICHPSTKHNATPYVTRATEIVFFSPTKYKSLIDLVFYFLNMLGMKWVMSFGQWPDCKYDIRFHLCIIERAGPQKKN